MIRYDGPALTGHRHLAALNEPLRALERAVPRLDTWALLVFECLSAGGRLLTVGNGNSAALGQHLTAEIIGRHADRVPFGAIALHEETSSMFAKQVDALGRPGDMLIAFSTTGSCSNVVASVDAARTNQMTALALTGPEPNAVANAANDALCVQSPYAATIHEVHEIAIHLLCAAFDAQVDAASQSDRGGGDPGSSSAAAIVTARVRTALVP